MGAGKPAARRGRGDGDDAARVRRGQSRPAGRRGNGGRGRGEAVRECQGSQRGGSEGLGVSQTALGTARAAVVAGLRGACWGARGCAASVARHGRREVAGFRAECRVALSVFGADVQCAHDTLLATVVSGGGGPSGHRRAWPLEPDQHAGFLAR